MTLTPLDSKLAFEGGGSRALEWLLEEQLEGLPRHNRGALDTAIHAHDEMLEYAYLHDGGDFEAGLLSYFRTAFEIVEAQRQLAEWWFGGWGGVGSLLDFGCGFGRAMRFLSLELDPNKIFVSDLYEEALDFQARRYGVQPLPSTSDPEALDLGRKFDFIWVGSLFTHLPERSFSRWLATLRSHLEDGGLLAFSTHHARRLPQGLVLPESGLFFLASSESHSHDLEEYGSAWVNESFVSRAVSKTGDPLHFFVPRALDSYQDLVVVPGGAPRQASLGQAFDAGPRVTIEHFNSEKPGRIEIEGWATYAGQQPRHRVEEIVVSIDRETVGRCSDFGERRDLVEALESEDALESAWSCVCRAPIPVNKGAATLIVKAISSSGRSKIVWCSSIDRAESYFNRQNWEASKREVARLERHIAWMEGSRFWRFRNRWFQLKRALGVTEEP